MLGKPSTAPDTLCVDPVLKAETSPSGEHVYKRGDTTFWIKKINWSDDSVAKFMVSMFKDDVYLGKFNFFTSDKFAPPEIIFSGLYLEPEFRSQGLSKLAMTELTAIAEQSGRIFDHALPQRKPLTCLILQKNGFSPCEINSNKHVTARNTVYVGKGDPEQIESDPAHASVDPESSSAPVASATPVYVHFPNPHKAKEFANSAICASQPYIVTPDISKIRDAVRCVLNIDYIR